MLPRLNIKTTNCPALTISRSAVCNDRLVYIAVANKPIRYKKGNSHIVYIGTTKCGAYRIAASAAAKGYDKLFSHGVTMLQFFVVTCSCRKSVKTWHKLERGLILSFKDIFGDPPELNFHGIKMVWRDEGNYFTKKRLKSVILKYSDSCNDLKCQTSSE